MWRRLRNLVRRRLGWPELTASSPSTASERAAVEAEKQALREKLHDQRARLHVLEWQAQVKARRPPEPKE